jgi:hypothetical protein
MEIAYKTKKTESGNGDVKRKNEGTFISRSIEPECESKRVPLDPRVTDRAVMISMDLSASEEGELLPFLDKNNTVLHGRPPIS